MLFSQGTIQPMSHNEWNQQWDKIAQQLQLKLPSKTFDAWVYQLHTQMVGNIVKIFGPNRFFLDGLKAHCGKEIELVIQEVLQNTVEIEYLIDSEKQTPIKQSKPKETKHIPSEIDGHINPRFTFDNFVIGSSNEFAYAACHAVAEEPGESYNPLYLYGGVGLGKTHLIHAIANKLSLKSGMKIAYRTGEEFTNELIKAIGNRSTDAFRKNYRKLDVLIIDDVQFIAGKVSTQEEFFHTFNALHEVHKQIILVSDRNPHNMSHLEDRLRSRFNCGLVTDIQPPNFETRLAILANKSALAGITLNQDVSYLLASSIDSNVRELEGALTRLTAYAHLKNKNDKTIDVEMAKNILFEQLKITEKNINIGDIQKKIAEYYAIPLKEMASPKRNRKLAFPRQVAMYISKELTQLSLPEIGVQFGNRDHTTILYACRKIIKKCHDEPLFQDEITQLLSSFKN